MVVFYYNQFRSNANFTSSFVKNRLHKNINNKVINATNANPVLSDRVSHKNISICDAPIRDATTVFSIAELQILKSRSEAEKLGDNICLRLRTPNYLKLKNFDLPKSHHEVKNKCDKSNLNIAEQEVRKKKNSKDDSTTTQNIVLPLEKN